MNTINKSTKLNYVRVIGYVFLAVTAIACAAWIMYHYYLISGWEPMHIFNSHPFWKVIYNQIPTSLVIVSLVGGAIANSKKERILSLVICYAYLLLVVVIMPFCWEAKDYTLMLIIEDIIFYCSWYSPIIIPVFGVSCFFAWCTKKLIKFLK
ncbi:MAG: hypothetical protein IJN63_03785 [Clostridia bacterium]|nr:hypothetical protein [Clostridia bacterium]